MMAAISEAFRDATTDVRQRPKSRITLQTSIKGAFARLHPPWLLRISGTIRRICPNFQSSRHKTSSKLRQHKSATEANPR